MRPEYNMLVRADFASNVLMYHNSFPLKEGSKNTAAGVAIKAILEEIIEVCMVEICGQTIWLYIDPDFDWSIFAIDRIVQQTFEQIMNTQVKFTIASVPEPDMAELLGG